MRTLTALALSTLLSSSALAQGLPTNGVIDSPIGKLEIVNGFPSDATVTKLFDSMDFQRATQAYIWALPYVAMAEWQRQQREIFGAGELDYVDYLDFKDKLGILTANATTPYTMAFPDLAKTGPLVFEIPPGPIAGGILDFWQRPLSDTGQTGPDKGKGGKFLVLGPGHPDIKPEGYFVLRSETNNVWSGQRGLDPNVEKAKALVAQLKIYPYADRDKRPDSKHLGTGGKPWGAWQPRGLAYWQELARLINQEPAIERDRMMLAMLVPLGIEKGKPFAPDERQRKILLDAVAVGELMARANAYHKRFPGALAYPDKKWEYLLFLKGVNQEEANYTQLDERSSYFYEAVGVTAGMMGKTVGFGQAYLEAQKDKNGAWLDGGKNYTLHVPKNAPVAQFWSLTIYDNETRALIDTGSHPDRSSRDNIVTNPDGSVDLYFGPQPPSGKPQGNWIKTLPQKGWFTYFRFYGPTQAYFDKTWQLPDIEQMN
ncbi:DUF1254 domain-containing protein [Bradyrhizobium sp. sGM-13]|uniref:DUF1254 domain-containing protein n=1 Tax=Bradyrhizobium sp. sGM-13 TaxID=2831781 RepID=UPI001BCBBB81|nr:DUF1254 domain-containing protein [Bradyrhizobium sp. sGM-13]